MCPGPEGVSAGFCLLAVWFAAVNGWRPLALLLGAAALHEAGHCLALRLCGVPIRGIRLGVLGAVLEADCSRLSYGRELACVLAGPAANLLCALVLSAVGTPPAAAGAHLVLGAFNLLPIRPLDGGRALYLLVSWAAGPAAGEWAARWFGAAAGASWCALLLFLMKESGGSLWLLPAALGAAASALRECAGGRLDRLAAR